MAPNQQGNHVGYVTKVGKVVYKCRDIMYEAQSTQASPPSYKLNHLNYHYYIYNYIYLSHLEIRQQ
jgi:hypothetical protein